MRFSAWIEAWLNDQQIDHPEMFPSDFDFDSTAEQLLEMFDDRIVNAHLDYLLTKHLLIKHINKRSIDP